jgi:UDP:flavonoid glycosyltransferase YjiC (YdhE family)
VAVRALFTFAGGRGHAEPLVPVAEATRAAGHTVALAGRASVAADLQARGFTVFPDPDGQADAQQTVAPLLELSVAREERVLRDAFAGRVARRRAAHVLAWCDEWSPDAIVCDEVDFGSMVAAERLGVPHATVLVIAAGSFVRAEVVAEPLIALRVVAGMACEAQRCADRALTLGTVFNLESGDLFARVQPNNAARCEALGVGRRLDAFRAGPETIREAVRAVLADPGYRVAAERIRAEIVGLPGPARG